MSQDVHPSSLERARALVWLVDDSPLQATFGKRAIAGDYDVEVFTDGATMLEALEAARPDLLIVDWHMPAMSGVEVCRFIRLTRDAAELPILVLTSSNASDDLVQAFAAGANDFVQKPFGEGALSARVGALLRNRDLYATIAETERRLRVEGEFREGFIGMLAHDLRQPLQTLLVSNRTMAAKRGDVDQLLAIQARAVDRMIRMVHELLDFARSRPRSGIPVERRPMNLAELVGDLLTEIRASQPERTFALTVEGDCSGSWDRDRLAQVCSNLLGNAIEHGAAGTPIDVRVARERDAVVFSVSNAGEPIPTATIATIFEPFRRGSRAPSRAGGVGLGLYIVSAIARAHDGTAHVRSDAEKTVFSVTLPVTPPAG